MTEGAAFDQGDQRDEKSPDACPSCGAKRFQVLYITSDAMFGSLVYSEDHWEFRNPKTVEYRVKCLDCGAIYDIAIEGDATEERR